MHGASESGRLSLSVLASLLTSLSVHSEAVDRSLQTLLSDDVMVLLRGLKDEGEELSLEESKEESQRGCQCATSSPTQVCCCDVHASSDMSDPDDDDDDDDDDPVPSLADRLLYDRVMPSPCGS
jgi:hypothetical protein